MNENAAKYVKLLQKHADRVFIGVMYALLLVLLFLWMQENNSAGVAAEEGEIKTVKFDDPVEKNPDFKRIFAMTKTQDISEYPLIDQLVKYNMFDYKSVKKKEALDREANQKFTQAQDAASKGQTEDAKRLLKDILAVMPTHQKARELYDKLTAPAGAANATPTPKP